MTQNTVIIILLLYILAREAFFLYSTHKFVNKIMSHNFHDYSQSIANEKPRPQSPAQFVPEDLEEDLGSLDGIGVL